MILLAFLSCFLLFFFVKDQIASFESKQIIVFLNQVFRVCLFDCVIATEFNYEIQYNRFRVVPHAVDSLNVKHELRSKKIKQFCIMQTFPNDISLFAT